ncbi:unnamed protein product [Pleuronectes platessa]|uniref:Uncharacterized protein n=1 Tax=Pleuronectes platessa TaxID=8262 RepID=A0A9N7U693_PLEPL|nr:unnamed protein product [Pleuronectes platessa]
MCHQRWLPELNQTTSPISTSNESVQSVFQSAITAHPPCIKLSFYFWAVGARRPISVPAQAGSVEDLLLSQFKSIVKVIYGDVSYLETSSSIFPLTNWFHRPM